MYQVANLIKSFSTRNKNSNRFRELFFLSEQYIHIWRLSRSAPMAQNEFCYLYSSLSPSEKETAELFRNPLSFHQFVYFRSFLRIILSKYLALKPHEIQFSYNFFGKPFLAGPDKNFLHFSLSHSNHLAFIAISTFGRIGLDIEFISRQRMHRDQIISKFFTRKEKNEYFSYSKELKTHSFYSGWTRKEAFIKALGWGLPWASHNCEVSMNPIIQNGTLPNYFVNRTDSDNEFACIDIKPETGFMGAFVADGAKSFFSRMGIPFSQVSILNSE